PGAPDAPCTELCLYNAHLQLVEIAPAPDVPPLATFVNEEGAQLELLATTVFTMPGNSALGPGRIDAVAAPPLQLLAATWRLDDNTHTQLHHSPTQMPVNYLHLTDAAGNVLAQADHPLGERRIELHDSRMVLDLVPLPTDAALAPATELRLGLWYPESAGYFWSPDAETDAVGRVRIGQLADLSRRLPLPAIGPNPAVAVTFTNAADGRSLRLLDASLTPNATPEHLQLSTIWEQRDLFIPRVSVTLVAHLTDQTGAALQSEAHSLETQRLTWHQGYLYFDRLDLPPTWILQGDGTDQEVWLEMIYLDSGQRYTADRAERVDANGRVRLGTLAELLRSSQSD
ncbi:MAG: hypothetical protein KDE53_16950, partial [Caldilineaceae bacterium]|nr:hypothetical protein [Caldilineaceae bacterium]